MTYGHCAPGLGLVKACWPCAGLRPARQESWGCWRRPHPWQNERRGHRWRRV